jgi:transcriptional antiterminator RfaH
MPLLPLETFVFPEDLLTSPPPPEPEEKWWVLHTRPRAEKSLARKFLNGRLSFYLPLYERRWRSRGRALSSFMPLFPGYVFLFGAAEARLAALATNLIVNVLPVSDQGRLRGDLVRVNHLLTAGSGVSPELGLMPGTPVMVVAGPLAGIEGKVLDLGKGLRFFIEVQFLQRGVSVEIDPWMVSPLTSTGLGDRAAGRVANHPQGVATGGRA